MFDGIRMDTFAPFGGFPGSGGGYGHSANGGTAAPDTKTKLYETLEVESTATATEIKKSFYRLGKIHHPDKGGDGHRFKEINAAYEILSDAKKRENYDKYGIGSDTDTDTDGGGATRGEHVFKFFFGGGS